MSQIAMWDTIQTKMVASTPYTGSVVYEAKGRAREYRELACNLYTGCDHGCVYCYAPDVLQRARLDFHKIVQPRTDIIKKVIGDAVKLQARGDGRQVLLCFACDPYCHANETHRTTTQAIKALHHYGLGVCVLTKGGMRAYYDIYEFTPRDSFACTLTTLDDKESIRWEPGAALPADRIEALKQFHARGIPTWVSLEPVLDPAVTLEIIRTCHDYVDEFKVGTLNYHPRANDIDWRRFAHDAKSLLDNLGIKYYLKNDLRRYL